MDRRYIVGRPSAEFKAFYSAWRPTNKMTKARRSTPIFDLLILLGVISISVTQWACSENRISGTYVTQGNDFAEILQLTQTDNGHVDGVMTTLAMSREEQMTSRHCQVSGAVDAGQITLVCHYGLLEDTNLAGTVNWRNSAIQFQWADPTGKVESAVFTRSSPGEFEAYADRLKVKAEGLILTKEVLKRVHGWQDALGNAESWIMTADAHAQKIPGIKDYFEKLDTRMRSLVKKEKTTFNAVERGQIAVAVNQSNIEGNQADLQIDQLWDRTIGDSGRNLENGFSSFKDSTCGPLVQYTKRGVTQEAIQTWHGVCQQLLVERDKFDPIFKRIMDQRTDLKNFQNIARSRREALVQEANRIE